MINKQFISSIYNYCDRWCDRCSMTDSCRLFADEKEQQLTDEEQDIRNTAFWNRISENFSEAMIKLEEMSSEMGINLDDLPPAPPRIVPEIHKELINQATQYGIEVNKWLNELFDYFEESLKLNGENRQVLFDSVIDFCEVLRWYSMQIGVKISRASRRDEDEEESTYTYDQNGSAKVAILGLERSIVAFTEILKKIPQYEDPILVFLAKLAIIKQEVNHLFPGAASFKRPGFDV